MKVDLFEDGCFLRVFAHHPGKTPHTVPAIGFFAIEHPNVGVFCLKILFQSDGHAFGQRHDAVFLVLTLAYMACSTMVKPDFFLIIRNYKVNKFRIIGRIG